MDSSELLRSVIHTKGVKAVAGELGVSQSLVYKWCQQKESEVGSGAENPLDRVKKIVEFTGDTQPIHWLCQSVDGFFIENPVRKEEQSAPVLMATQALLAEFSELLGAVSRSYENDGQIDASEADQIRVEWEQLKTAAEHFVVACEKGVYQTVS